MFYILNHYSRDASESVKQLEAQGATVMVFTDQTDFYKNRRSLNRYEGLNDNYLKIMEHKTDDDWKIVIHDDIKIPNGLVDKIHHVLTRSPKEPISFYNPTNKDYIAGVASGHHVLKTGKNIWIPLHAIPTILAYDFAAWAREHHYPVGSIAEDSLIKCWAAIQNHPLYAIMPSLVQHDGFADSTFGTSPKVGHYERTSQSYDPDFDVTAIDWIVEFMLPYIEGSKQVDFTGIDGRLRGQK